MKYRFAGKERRLVLGVYPDLGLREARDRKADAKRLVREGRDPGIEAAKARVERAVPSANTIEALARGWYALQEPRWTRVHASDVIGSLERRIK
jgi:hypothetical protein